MRPPHGFISQLIGLCAFALNGQSLTTELEYSNYFKGLNPQSVTHHWTKYQLALEQSNNLLMEKHQLKRYNDSLSLLLDKSVLDVLATLTSLTKTQTNTNITERLPRAISKKSRPKTKWYVNIDSLIESSFYKSNHFKLSLSQNTSSKTIGYILSKEKPLTIPDFTNLPDFELEDIKMEVNTANSIHWKINYLTKHRGTGFPLELRFVGYRIEEGKKIELLVKDNLYTGLWNFIADQGRYLIYILIKAEIILIAIIAFFSRIEKLITAVKRLFRLQKAKKNSSNN